MRRATLDPALSVRFVSERPLVYSTAGHDDRPAHVRAASGVVVHGDRLLVIQDDTAFIASVEGVDVGALVLPAGTGGRRRFEVALGNKLDKLDLESGLVVGDELWAFGSASMPIREKIVRIQPFNSIAIVDAHAIYAAARAEIGVLNIEGIARHLGELWLFHRGNAGPDDRPAVVRFEFVQFSEWLDGGSVPDILGIDCYDLGDVGGVRFGFTDAVARGERVYFTAAAEGSPNAIDDGPVAGAMLGVIEGDRVRFALLPSRKVEGLAFKTDTTAWITIDPDDVDTPAPLCEIELHGPW